GVSKLPQYAYGKRVIFIDKEAWVVPYSDIYDRSGELWKIWINDWSFKKKAFDGAGVIEYPDEMGFQPSIVMVDLQLEHATKASLPSPRFPGEQGWYFNQGEKAGISDEFFTVAALVNAGIDVLRARGRRLRFDSAPCGARALAARRVRRLIGAQPAP